MSIKPFAFPLPETRLFLAGCRVYKFRIRTSCRANQKVNKNQATQEIEDAIRVVLENLDHLQPFTTNHFNVFPYKSKWEKVCHLCSRHTGLRVPAYPFLLTLFLEEREAAPLHTAKRPVDEMPTTAGEADAVTPHYSAVRHPKRSRIEPLGGSPDQHSCWRPEAWEELESQFGKRTESRPQPDGLEAMGADKGATVPMSPSKIVTPALVLLVSRLFFLMLLASIGWSYDGLSPGCHLYPFNVTIRSDRRGTCRGTHTVYACVGHCESSAFPSRYAVLVASNFTHNITSASRCCAISKDTKVKVRLDCPHGRHHDDIEILSARACRCDMCRKSRY
ncbi:membrane-anchored junction protein-like isoform X2 [Brienomyrus brachyistius]|uniref:membrane-anchored junction protein-like isoform X2 n=1 Tax=Brienomyrus brachyistius TaxID=42636 RepID=UPI0020B2E5C0|nr:membrane-anchored junction protein-like isoform X2 [Brienomyrus brachyistius]